MPYLHHLQLLQSLLYECLYLSWVLYARVLSECVSRSALRVLSEVVGLKLLALTQQLAVLDGKAVHISPAHDYGL